MAEMLYETEILEAIDHVRARKSRPDLKRICAYLCRKHGLYKETVKQALSNCVEAGIVFKAEYKGLISYRNAAKSSHQNPHPILFRGNLLYKVYTELSSKIEDLTEVGLSIKDFIDALLIQQPEKTSSYFDLMITGAMNHGIFIKLPNGNIIANKNMAKFISNTQVQGRDQITNKSSKTPLQKKLWSLRQKYRAQEKFKSTGSKKKTTKKIFELFQDTNTEDTNNKNKETLEKTTNAISISEDEPTEAAEYRICEVCQKLITMDRRVRKIEECVVCSSKTHYDCAHHNYNVVRSGLRKPWKCPQCICCEICKKTSITDPLITCVSCSSSYHKKCHTPCVRNNIHPLSFWLCGLCENEDDFNNENAKSKFFCSPGTITRLKYDSSEHKAIWQKYKPRIFGAIEEGPIDESVPDVLNWTTDEIYIYMLRICPKAASSFKERGINGAHLLKMSRVEVIQGLGLKLGPALKVFKHITILQRRNNDPKCYYL